MATCLICNNKIWVLNLKVYCPKPCFTVDSCKAFCFLQQVKTARWQIRPHPLCAWPRPRSGSERERRGAPEPPVGRERRVAKDWSLYPRRPNHRRAQQTDTGSHDGQREALTAAAAVQSESESHLRLQVNRLPVWIQFETWVRFDHIFVILQKENKQATRLL